MSSTTGSSSAATPTTDSTTTTTLGKMTTTKDMTTLNSNLNTTTAAPTTATITTTIESTAPSVNITVETTLGRTANATDIQTTPTSSEASQMTESTLTSNQSTSAFTTIASLSTSGDAGTTTVGQTTDSGTSTMSSEVITSEIGTTGNQMATTTGAGLSTSVMDTTMSLNESSTSSETVTITGSESTSQSSVIGSILTTEAKNVFSTESVTDTETSTREVTPTSEPSTSSSTVGLTDSTQTLSSNYMSSTDLTMTNGTTMFSNETEPTTNIISSSTTISSTAWSNDTSETTLVTDSTTLAPSSTVETSFESTSEISGSTMESSTSAATVTQSSELSTEAETTIQVSESTTITETSTQANGTSESTDTLTATVTSLPSIETTETTQTQMETTFSPTEEPSTESSLSVSIEPTTMETTDNTTSIEVTQSTESEESSTSQPTEVSSESVTAQTSESVTMETPTAQPTESSSEGTSPEGSTIQTTESTTMEAPTTESTENTTVQTSTAQTTITTSIEQSTTQTTLSTQTTVNLTLTPVVPPQTTPVSTSTTVVTTVQTATPTSQAGALAAILVPSVLLFIIILGIVFAGFVVFKRRNRNKMRDEEIAGNDVIITDMLPLTQIHKVTNGVAKREKLDASLPYDYDEDGDLVYTGKAKEQPIPVKELQSHIIKLQEEGQFSTDYQSLPDGMILPTTDSELEENKAKNRYTNMLAYNHSRVKLKGLPAGQSDYINANYIDGFKKKKAYIATQGPLKSTTPDFWNMVWQEEAKKIVMVTNLKEKNRVKCYQYWPNEKKSMTCQNLRVSTDAENVYPVFVLRKIKITDTKTDESRMVTQYHFTAWPDHGVPDAFQLLQFFRKVTGNGTEYDVTPTVVHCSAGVGRTGTYIGLDALWKEGFKTGYVDILSFARKMRKNRTKMIQTLDQYIFLHFILMEAFANPDAAVPTSMIQKLKGPKDPKIIQRVNAEFEKLNSLRPEYNVTDYQDALHPKNQSKNRTQDNLPVDNYRARLSALYGDEEDYINAVIIPSSWNQEGILMTQYPLPNTIADFWTMIYSYKCPSVVLLDDSTDYAECFYPSLEQTSEWGRLVIQTTAVSEPQDCVTETTVTLTNTEVENEDEMEVKIFTGHGWNSSNELPDEQKLLHCLHYEVQKRQTKLGEQKPVVVVCRNGVKQSGLYCAVCNILEGIDWYTEVTVYHCVRQIQMRKPEAIRSKTQYEYCYQVALTYLDSSNVYENNAPVDEEEERESEYANIGKVRSSLKMDPIKEPGVKGLGKKPGAGQGNDELYANFGATSSEPKKTSKKKEMMTSI